jgi:sulfonate transport system substrate-binding protein
MLGVLNAVLLCSIWSVAAVGCSREPEVAAQAKLAFSARLPDTFARDTKLVLGDPTVQKQLVLTNKLSSLPCEIEWHNVTGGPGTIEAFRGQALDGGAVGDTPPIHAEFTGLDVRIIAVQQRTRATSVLAIAPGAGIKKLEDIKGKRIAYSPGQAQGALVLRVLKRLGLRTTDVQLIELSSYEFKDALGSRQVDVAPLGGAILSRYLKAFGKEGASSLEHGVRDGLNFYYVRKSVLEDPNKAAALREYVKVRTRAQLWSYHHPEVWIPEYYVKDQGLAQDDARYIVESLGAPQFPGDWSESIAFLQQTVDLLAEASGKPRFDAAKLFDRRFERVAAAVADEYASNAPLRTAREPQPPR